jgi:hypothetical protein
MISSWLVNLEAINFESLYCWQFLFIKEDCMLEFDVWKELDVRLLEHGSWLYDEDGSRLDFSTFFDPFSEEFLSMPVQRKLLVLRELFYCKVEPILLSTLYRMYCIQYRHDDLYADFGQALLEIIKSVTGEDVSLLDIHNPRNWFKGKEENTYSETAHDATIWVLEEMMPELQEQLIAQKDPLIRKRLVYFNRTENSGSILIVPNKDPLLDKVDEELLQRVDVIEPDVKMRYGEIQLMAEDIYDVLDPEHKKERIALAELLYKSIENMDLETLKELPMYSNANVDHFVDIKLDPKKWLYGCVSGFALKRDLCRIRGVDFVK